MRIREANHTHTGHAGGEGTGQGRLEDPCEALTGNKRFIPDLIGGKRRLVCDLPWPSLIILIHRQQVRTQDSSLPPFNSFRIISFVIIIIIESLDLNVIEG